MTFAQERIVPKEMRESNGLLIEHKKRYEFASNYTQGRVLDIACGVGYGSEVLFSYGEGIKKVIGVDNNKEVIKYARANYDFDKTEYLVADARDEKLKEELGTFDTIVSMETIEHIKDDYLFVENLTKLLKEDGSLIISTPYGKGRGVECSNPYHYRQYKKNEFITLLKSYFSKIKLFGQLNDIIEPQRKHKKYYLMVAICNK